jgi:signal recognition particle GTPase
MKLYEPQKIADSTTQILCIELEQSKLLAELSEKLNSTIDSFTPSNKAEEDIEKLEQKLEQYLREYSIAEILCSDINASLQEMKDFRLSHQQTQIQKVIKKNIAEHDKTSNYLDFLLDTLSDIYFMTMGLKEANAHVL